MALCAAVGVLVGVCLSQNSVYFVSFHFFFVSLMESCFGMFWSISVNLLCIVCFLKRTVTYHHMFCSSFWRLAEVRHRWFHLPKEERRSLLLTLRQLRYLEASMPEAWKDSGETKEKLGEIPGKVGNFGYFGEKH